MAHQAATTCKGNCSTSLTLQTRIDDYVKDIKRLNKENLEVAEKHRKELEEVKKAQVDKKTISKAEIKKAQTKAVTESNALQDNLDHYESLIDSMKTPPLCFFDGEGVGRIQAKFACSWDLGRVARWLVFVSCNRSGCRPCCKTMACLYVLCMYEL